MSGSEEGFQWFGEGFDGFPRGLPEDCVEYTLYVIDATLQDDEVRRKLRDVQASANVLTKQLLKGFIWQRERFKLELARENGAVFHICLAYHVIVAEASRNVLLTRPY